MKINGVVAMLKRKAPKIIQINDIIDWYDKNEIILSPKYQRNSVWNEKAKSYLIDSIIRGLPIPPIFMRQTIEVDSRKTLREIIDGQQRLRAITEFIHDGFPIAKMHNEQYGGLFYSQLDDDVKESILEYELFIEIINEKDDTIIYDMFARLNTNNYVLNRQEIRNAKYWGEFKVAAYNNAAEYRDIFVYNNIFNDKQLSRMEDVEFISTLLNLTINGVETDSPSSIDKLYQKYDKVFSEYANIKNRFDQTMQLIRDFYEYLNDNVICFTSKTYFYTLFAVIYHQMHGLSNLNTLKRLEHFSAQYILKNFSLFMNSIIQFEYDYGMCINEDYQDHDLYAEFIKFAKYHRTRTTNKTERIDRITFLNNCLVGG